MNKKDSLLYGDWERINSFATDTCSTMLSIWKLLENDERLWKSWSLMVPCDCHGLQLLIGDIHSIPYYKEIHHHITQIITTFRSSPKQLSILQEKQNPFMARPVLWFCLLWYDGVPRPRQSTRYTTIRMPLSSTFWIPAAVLIILSLIFWEVDQSGMCLKSYEI